MIKKFSLSSVSLLLLASLVVGPLGVARSARADVLLSAIDGDRGQVVLPKVDPVDVKVFIGDVRCPEKFEPVVVFWGHGVDVSGEGRVLADLKKKAAIRGANGLILGVAAMLCVATAPVEDVELGDPTWAVIAIRFKTAG